MSPRRSEKPEASRPRPRPRATMDEGFLRRVRTMSWIAVALGGVFGAGYLGWRWGVGFALAGAWSVVNLIALERLVRLSLRPAGREKGAIALALVIKLPVLYGIGILIAIFGDFPAESLLAGIAIPFVVMVLKAGGQVLAPRVALPEPEAPEEGRDGNSEEGDAPGSLDAKNPNGR